MIPILDENPHHTKPIATLFLMAVLALVFLLEFVLDARGLLDQVLYQFGFIPAALWGQMVPLPDFAAHNLGFWSLLSYPLLHAGWLHILPNLLFLWIFGDNVEDAFGRKRYLIFFFVAAAFSGIVHVLLAGAGSVMPLIGASGAISALLGVYFRLYPSVRVRVCFPTVLFLPPLVLFGVPFLWFFYVPAYLFLGLWFALDLYQALFTASESVSFWAHIAGFAFGYVLAHGLRREDETSYYKKYHLSSDKDGGNTDLPAPIRRSLGTHPFLKRRYHDSPRNNSAKS